MDGISRTCLACQAELRPETRFCPKCGQWAGGASPGSAPPGQELAPRGGPGATIAAPSGAAPPAAAPPAAAPPAAGWNALTATQTAFPSRPYQAPLPPPTRALPPAYPPQPYPPAAYQQGPYDQRPYEPPAYDSQGFEPFRRYEAPVPPTGPGGPSPGAQYQPPRQHDQRRSGWPAAAWIILLVLVIGGGAAAFILVKHPFSHPALSEAASTGSASPAGPSAGAIPGDTETASPGAPGSGPASPGTAGAPSTGASTPAASSPPAVSEQQAATNVASMLSQSGSDRSAIISAANDVGTCGPDLTSDPKVFDDAASSRKALLASLTTMSGRATLPPALVSDLTKAWQASIAADQAYARWATDEIAQGCVPNDTSDPGYRATTTPNTEATTYKTAFAAQWNPIAGQYGLTQYQPGQL